MLAGTPREKRRLARYAEKGLSFRNVKESMTRFLAPDSYDKHPNYECCFLGLALVGKRGSAAKAFRHWKRQDTALYRHPYSSKVLGISKFLIEAVERLHMSTWTAFDIIKRLRKEAKQRGRR